MSVGNVISHAIADIQLQSLDFAEMKAFLPMVKSLKPCTGYSLNQPHSVGQVAWQLLDGTDKETFPSESCHSVISVFHNRKHLQWCRSCHNEKYNTKSRQVVTPATEDMLEDHEAEDEEDGVDD